MQSQLDAIEQRVLGVLIEKSLTQPGYYPMTVNAITLGANQKQNRDPVVEWSEGQISAALQRLEHKALVSQSPPAIGARSVRFRHHAVDVFHWDRREQAVMAELLLRDRQTAGELRARAGRMTAFDDLESVNVTLSSLRDRETPFLEELAREPGRSANRFRHQLGSGPAAEGLPPPPQTAALQGDHAPDLTHEGREPVRYEALAKRVARLEAEVAALRERIADRGIGNEADG